MILPVRLPKLVDGYGELLAEELHRAQHPWVQEVHLREYVECVVLKRRTAHAQTVLGIQQAGGLRYLARRVFDRLRFIQDHIIEFDAHQQLNITAQRAISSDRDVMISQLVFYPRSGGAMMDAIAQLRREFPYLIFPVINKRGGANDQRLQSPFVG